MDIAARDPLPWTPPGGTEVRLLPAGRWWDAVRVTRPLAEQALAVLGPDTGAVIEDDSGALLYWLIKPGAADEWPRLPQVEVLGRATYVGVPPVAVTSSRARWRVPLAHDCYLTDPALLRAALEAAA